MFFNKKMLSFFLLIVLLTSTFIGCTNTNLESTKVSKRSIIDMTGAIVNLPEQVQKVFCDWGSGITLIMTLGATEKLVAVYTSFDSDSFAWAREICSDINSVKRDDSPFSNPEAILAYNPDIVITNNIENIEPYSNLGLITIYVDYSDNDAFMKSLRIVGEALGYEEKKKAEKYCNYFEDNIRMVEERLENLVGEKKPTVYYMDSRFGDVYHTVGTGEIQEEWISIAGGVLATKNDFKGRNIEITAEKMLGLDPDIIMIGAQKQSEVYETLMEDKILSSLSAVRNNYVYRIPQGIFPWCRTGAEAAIQVVWAAKTLYPTLFEDIDMIQVTKDFYKECFDADISTEVVSDILAGKMSPKDK